MNISKKNSKGKGAVGKTGSKRTAAKRVEEDVHDYFRDDGDDDDSDDEIDEEDEEPSLDALPYREELAMCSPAMRELEEDVAEDMAGYMEERI